MKGNNRLGIGFLMILLVVSTLSLHGSDSLAGAGKGDNRVAPQSKRFFVKASMFYFRPADAQYREIYQQGHVLPQVGAGFRLWKWLYCWVNYGFITASTTAPGTDYTLTVKQNFLSAGVGYPGRISEKIGYTLQMGLVAFHFQEEAFETRVSGSTTGVYLGTGILYHITGHFFLEATVAYSSGTGGDFSDRLSLGGIQSGLSLGFRF